MKKILTCTIAIFVAMFVISCKCNTKTDVQKVINASYEIYTNGEERGYGVSFETYGRGIEPTAVVINKVRSDFSISDRKDGVYYVDVIVHTMKITGYRPQISNHKNGVIYKIGDVEKFVPVEFRLKK